LNLYGYALGNPTYWSDLIGLAVCTYDISDTTMSCVPNAGGPASVVGPSNVFSGVGPCRNNPQCADKGDEGPVRPGNYRMNRDDRPGHDRFWRLEPTPKIPGWKCALGIERCGFEFHPGHVSLGCITVNSGDKAAMQQYDGLNELLNREDGNNTLTVVP
jgi:hypothetical protein